MALERKRGWVARRLGRNAADAGVLSEVRFTSHDAFVPSLAFLRPSFRPVTAADKRKGFEAENIEPLEVE